MVEGMKGRTSASGVEGGCCATHPFVMGWGREKGILGRRVVGWKQEVWVNADDWVWVGLRASRWGGTGLVT